MTSASMFSASINAATFCASTSGSSLNIEMLPRPSLMRTRSGRMLGSRSSSVFTTLYPAIRPWVSGVVPPTDSLSSLRRASETLDVGRSTTSAVRFLKMTTATRSRRTYASCSRDRIAPLVAAIRCSASIDADASTTNTIRLPIFRSRTF